MAWERWRRVPEPNACDFCLTLASRGAVYKSKITAAGKRYHRMCRCTAAVEGKFSARNDTAIPEQDANRIVKMRVTKKGKTYVYVYDLSKFPRLKPPPKVKTPAPVNSGVKAARQSPGPWLDDQATVRTALRNLGIGDLDGWMDDFHIRTNGVDVVEIPRMGSDGRPMRSWRQRVEAARVQIDAAEREVRFLQSDIDAHSDAIERRLTELWAWGADQQDLDLYRRGRKVDGKTDPEIVRLRKLIRQARIEMKSVKSNVAEHQQLLDDFAKVKVRPLTDRDFELSQQMAEDLDHVLARMPSWRRYQPDGTPRGYALQLDDFGCEEMSANAYTSLGAQRIFISTRTVLDRSPSTGTWSMRAGGAPNGRRITAHEVGHTVDHQDNVQRDAIFERWKASKGREWRAVSEYGQTHSTEMYAELFAEWMYGDRNNPAVVEFARVFKWAESTGDAYWDGKRS